MNYICVIQCKILITIFTVVQFSSILKIVRIALLKHIPKVEYHILYYTAPDTTPDLDWKNKVFLIAYYTGTVRAITTRPFIK